MLIACPTCHRQYDVGDLTPGKQVRCACGELMAVPEVVPRRVRMLHCSSCGGRLPGEGEPCEFCEARPDPTDLERSTPCPACFARISGDASFCDTCGVEITIEAVVQAISDHDCPRCESRLRLHEGGRGSFYSCPDCEGIWLSRQAVDRIVDEVRPADGVRYPEPLPRDLEAERARRERDGSKERQAPQIRCPVCTHVMRRFPFGGHPTIEVDTCHRHGFWFDADELTRIREFVAQGGLAWARQRRSTRNRIFRRQRQRIRRQRRESAAEGASLLAALAFGMSGPRSS